MINTPVPGAQFFCVPPAGNAEHPHTKRRAETRPIDDRAPSEPGVRAADSGLGPFRNEREGSSRRGDFNPSCMIALRERLVLPWAGDGGGSADF